MIRLPPLLAAAAAIVGFPAAAQATEMRAEFATPFAQASEVVIDGRMWSCNGTACTARGDDPRPAVACRKLARKVGAITRFTTPQSDLNEAGLATCNQDRK